MDIDVLAKQVADHERRLAALEAVNQPAQPEPPQPPAQPEPPQEQPKA